MDPTQAALEAAVLATPGDDTPRLILADWLDENSGSSDCPKCGGSGKARMGGHRLVADPVYGFRPEYVPLGACLGCRGSGQIPDDRAARAAFIRDCLPLLHKRVRPGKWEWRFDRFGDGAFTSCYMPMVHHVQAVKVMPRELKSELQVYTIRKGFVDTVQLDVDVWARRGIRGRLLGMPLTGVAFTGIMRFVRSGGRLGFPLLSAGLHFSRRWFAVPSGRPGGPKCPGLALCHLEWPGIKFTYAAG